MPPPSTHTLTPSRSTLHGAFSPDLPPCLTLASGERAVVETVDVTWGIEQHGAPGTSRARAPKGAGPRWDGPALCGPIAVDGAEPGDALVITLESITPASWGWSYAGDGLFNAPFNRAVGVDEELLLRWALDRDAGVARSERGHTVPLRPILGTVGCAPAAPGWHSGWEPRRTGGNLDCAALTAGSVLELPVAVPGGRLSLGDGHAVQGDGEVGGSAIECPMEQVVLRCDVRPGGAPAGPRARTPRGRVTLGLGPTLDAAAPEAVRGMLDWLESDLGGPRAEWLSLLSLQGSLRVTQVVNGTVGVHLIFDPDGRFPRP